MIKMTAEVRIIGRGKLAVASALFVLGACADEPSERERLEEALSYAESGCSAASIAYNQSTIPQLEGEWDIAAAENVDTISLQGEMEIRRTLGAEMGLHPSEVNGWKEIHRSRAQAAIDQQGEVKRQIEEARLKRDGACDEERNLRAELAKLPVE